MRVLFLLFFLSQLYISPNYSCTGILMIHSQMFETQIIRQKDVYAWGIKRYIFFNIYIFCLTRTTPATLKWEVYSLLKRTAAFPLDMLVKHCKSFMSVFIL